MLHEILLSLSGHPSALFDAPDHVTSTTAHGLLHPSEKELLSSIGHLSQLHRETRDHVARIAAAHPSIICRAVATSITSHHLEQFQRKILEVESRILKQDSSTVGAYNIVPLAGVVSEFSEWVRVMTWLWTISNYMLPSDAVLEPERISSKAASGAAIMDKLRTEAQTGFPDIADAAHGLSKVAETSWLRQLSTWLLYGRLPSFGRSDFFIQQDDGDADEQIFILQNKLLPKFVTRQTALSILFVGKSLNQIRSLPSAVKASNSSNSASELDLLPKHVQHLAGVSVPVVASQLSEAVANIRLSLSRNLLQHLLPREKIVETLNILHQFFLIGRGEFALTLIAEADDKISSRHRGQLAAKSSQSTKGVLLKDVEISHILTRSLSILSTLSSEDEHTDDILDEATQLLHLSINTSSTQRPGTPGRAKDMESSFPLLPNASFDELLLGVPTSLAMDIRSPLDLFITKTDLDVYSSINACLLAVRRAHLHLAELWRHSSIRRDYPCPPGYQFSNSAHGKAMLKRRRQRAAKRAQDMRRIWATCAAAIFFLVESEAYFHGTVVQQTFAHFINWVTVPEEASSSSAEQSSSSRPATATATSSGLRKSTTTTDSGAQQQQQQQQHDPEALASAHRRFLSSIAYSLLLTDPTYTKTLRTLCTHVDELVAYISRLTLIQQNLDLEEDEGVEDYAQNYKKEEGLVSVEMDRARRRLDADLKAAVERLREIDSERIGASAPGSTAASKGEVGEGKGYEPLRVGGIDRLLMKLDWSGEDEGDEEVEDLL
ncbi:Spc97 Spc98 family [Pyrenophora seminiperda CCB06]|uniref:Spindle pole body component n=1 Tax=Pyrenophora seminiperda CCB06 TaxID=1302712 RepID=A0A3M7MDF2_9PLEO|nr:Spc97 Spc98 family [Pyrenophora seminiperda CCB06]